MEVISQTPIASPYVTAPSSPFAFSLDNKILYYSAPTSPTKRLGNPFFGDQEYDSSFKSNNTTSSNSNSNDFEFGTSVNFDWPFDDDQENGAYLLSPTMAFADEIFSNGKVKPLKLPPRLQHGNEVHTISRACSVSSSPRSTSSVFKKPFGRRVTCENNFDPFLAALQKVTEEKRGRRKGNDYENIRRRARSQSPFKTTTMELCTNLVKPIEPKGFIYARWVRDQTKHVKISSPKGAISTQNKSFVAMENTRMQKIKVFLLKYASFGRKINHDTKQNQISSIWKPNYFRKLRKN